MVGGRDRGGDTFRWGSRRWGWGRRSRAREGAGGEGKPRLLLEEGGPGSLSEDGRGGGDVSFSGLPRRRISRAASRRTEDGRGGGAARSLLSGAAGRQVRSEGGQLAVFFSAPSISATRGGGPPPPRSRPPTLGTTEAKFRAFGPVTCRGGSPVLPYCRLVGRLRPSVGRLGWQPTALGQRLLPSSPWPPPLRGVPDWWCKSCSAWGGSVRGSRLCSRWITLLSI